MTLGIIGNKPGMTTRQRVTAYYSIRGLGEDAVNHTLSPDNLLHVDMLAAYMRPKQSGGKSAVWVNQMADVLSHHDGETTKATIE